MHQQFKKMLDRFSHNGAAEVHVFHGLTAPDSLPFCETDARQIRGGSQENCEVQIQQASHDDTTSTTLGFRGVRRVVVVVFQHLRAEY